MALTELPRYNQALKNVNLISVSKGISMQRAHCAKVQ